MGPRRHAALVVAIVIVLLASVQAVPAGDLGFVGGLQEAYGPRFGSAGDSRDAPRIRPRPGLDPVRRWNEIALDASGLDHTPVAPGEPRVFGEQIGPGRASRAMAIVHIAMFDAINAIVGGYRGYTDVAAPPGPASLGAAIAEAAHDTLVALYPSQQAALDALLTEDLERIADANARRNGIDLGRRAAAAILARRSADGSEHAEPRVGVEFLTADEPGSWRQDPVSEIPLALGAYWGKVAPFVLGSADELRVPPPPALGGGEYAAAYQEVTRLGGDGVATPTERTADQTHAALYWAYDGTPSLCAPPRLYNQIAVRIAGQMRSDLVEVARLLALVNVAMADAGIAVWESKYHYSFWRPVTGIREADDGTGPTGAGDGNPATAGDPTFVPLGAPASNLTGPSFTPPFPAYPSGHAANGGAVRQKLRHVDPTHDITLSFVSDEFNGVTRDRDGTLRPLAPRSFASLSEAEEENGQSRVYLGIHWSFDKTAGIAQGRRVADAVFRTVFTPLRPPRRPDAGPRPAGPPLD